MSYLHDVYVSASEENRRAILKAMPRRDGATLLDVGCGDGEWTLEVGRHIGAGRVLGVELTDEWGAAARARGVEVEQTDVANPLPYDDASIDVVHSNQVIEHLANTDIFLREIRRVLKPGGYVCLSTNNLASWHNVVSLVLGWQPPPVHVSDELIAGNPANFGEGNPGSYGQMHLRIFTHRALAALAAHHGLALEHRGASGYYPLPPRPARVMARVDGRHAAYLVHRYVPAG